MNDKLFSSTSFSPKYDWFSREIEDPQYFAEDMNGSPMTGESLCDSYKVNPIIMNIHADDKVQVIDVISPDKSNSSAWYL